MNISHFAKNTLYFIGISLFFYQCGENDPEPVDCSNSGPSVTVNTVQNATCSQDNGEVTVTVTGGTGLEFSIAGSSFQPIAAGSATITGLPAGSQTLTIRDANSCTATASFTVEDDNDLSADLTTEVSGCMTANGSVTVTAAGGSEPYNYILDGGSNQSGNVFSGLASGDYTVLVLDDAGCETSVTITVTTGTSYIDDIKPIIDTNCALSGCHDGSNASVPDWTVLANVQDKADNIKTRTSAGTMPPQGSGITLDQSDIDAIGCWVDDGNMDN